ncbi:hypothetical protein [Litoreibacter roseus]|uniref:Uncharacterized protein n=1 Tax=Litoreibacter roseus TaxID=2601869 RepID=A0A6N6JB53_9RHOB|nr:hypothetical protein [Litoreibacter roseus]GFE63463.1 hypothetical protein KIN_05370 [Litoreibacter roseus]
MSHRPIREVEDYTKPFLWMLCVLLFIGFITLWATFGYLASLLSGAVAHLFIGRLPRRD